MKSVRKDAGILSDVLGRWRRGIARACRWRHDGAVIPGSKRGLSPVIVPHLLLTLFLVLAFASPAWAALSRISKASAQANSVAITTPSSGDLILVFAHRDGSTTAPSLAAGYTNINSSGANTNSSRIGYKISNGTETTSGTWTNATSVAVVVYRGHDPTTPIGATGSGGAASATIAYNTFTLQVTDGSSWVAGFAGHRTATNVGQAPTGMQLQTSATDVAASDTNGGVSSWSTQSVGVNANSGWRSWAIEIRAQVLNNFLVEAAGGGSIGGQNAGLPFSIMITARDANFSTVTGFTGTVSITSTGTLSAGGGTTASFTAGVLTSHSVTISNTGSFTITATKTAGTETGTSNVFAVNPVGQNFSSCTPLSASSFTWSHTTTGSNRILIVGVSIRNSSGQIVSTGTPPTYAGTPLTLVGVQDNGTSVRVELWRLVAPALGANNVVVTLSATAKAACGALSLADIDQGSPIDATAFASSLANFDKVWDFNNPAYTDLTTAASNATAADVSIFRTDSFTAADFFYVGRASKFTRVEFNLSTLGAGVTLAAEYWNGSIWTALSITDHTINLTASGDVMFTPPASWATTAVNGSTQYWVRFKTTTNPTTAPVGTQVQAQAVGDPSVTITTVADNAMIVDAIAFRHTGGGGVPTGTAGSGQTERWSGYSSGGGEDVNVGGKGSTEGPKTPAGAVVMDWTLSESTAWAAAAVSLKPVGPLNNFLVEAAGGGAIGTQTAGTPFNIKLTARDANNNTVTGFTGTVDITSTGILSAGSGTTASFTAGVLASHSVTISNTGSFTITATKTAGSEAGTSNAFTVNGGTFTKLQLLVPGETAAPGTGSGKTGTPTAQTAGSAFTVTVNAVDANWNVVSSTDTVGITSSDAGATLPANAALVSGTKTFSVTLNTAGTATVTATDITDGNKTANTSPSITVNAALFPFSFRKSITIDRTKVGNSGAPTTLASYPFLYNVTDTDLKHTSSGGDVTDLQGDDIIFRAFDATTCNDGQSVCTLDHEIEQYDPTTGKLVAWVNIPVLNTTSASSNTVIYIFYGNAAITTSIQNANGVWDTNFKAVWHLNQDPSQASSTECSGSSSANVICDSTLNNKDGDPFTIAAGALITEASGNPAKIGKAIDFDGGSDYIEVPSPSLPTGDFTYSAWVKRDSTSTINQILFISSSEIWWQFLASDTAQQTLTNTTTAANGTTANGTAYHYLTWSRSASTIQVYFDGAAEGTPGSDSTALDFSTCQLLIAASATTCNTTPANWFDGPLDEIRVSDIARSAHWIKTEYNNMNSPSTFYTVGAEESNPPSAVKLRGARAVAYEGAYAQTVQLKWRTSHEVDHLGFHVYREQAGQLLRLTPSLLAGSALLARGRTELTAGQRYSWWDVLPAGSGPLQYWLEEIDLHGRRTWHGPIAVTSAQGRRDAATPEQVRSVLLSKLGRGKHKGRLPGAPWQGAADAATPTPTAAQLAVQGQLAAGPAIKLGVSAEGWYRVDQPTLIAAGLDPKVDARRLKLFADGIEVPMVVTGGQDGRLQPRDTIEFYGVGLDTPWTDTRTYWLVAGQQAGQRIDVASQPHLLPGGAKAPTSFPFTVTWQPRELYFAALRNGEADNFFGPVVSSWPTEQPFTLNHLDPAPPGAARLEVTLQGVTDGPHAVDVQVKGTSVGTMTFAGQGQGRTEFSVLSSQLQEGANLVTLVALGGELDVSLVATVRLTYWHTYTAEEDVLRGSVPAGQAVTIGGFSTTPISVLDVTQPDAVRVVPGQVKRQGGSFAVTVMGPGPGTRTLLAFTARIAATPAKIQANQPSRWQSGGRRADLVMIGHPTMLPSLATLKAWREQQGWTVALIDVEDLYDEFTFGAKSPWALRALVQTARTRWAQPPRFLLLGGDASFDPRDTQGMGETDFVPTKLIDTDLLETASDDWFGDLDGDGVAEVAVGRLAVRTAEEAATVVQKLIGYDQTAAARTALLVADTPDSLDFEGASTRLAELLPRGVAAQTIYRSQSDDATTRGALLAALNSGAWLVNYLGHGSVEVWRGEVFTSQDASTLTNGLRLPFVATMTCLNGFFHDVYTESLAEALQRAPQGGAVAVWASSSLSEAAEQVDMNRRLLQGLSAGLTLGDAVAQAKAVARDRNVRRTWILFGDPTTRLR